LSPPGTRTTSRKGTKRLCSSCAGHAEHRPLSCHRSSRFLPHDRALYRGFLRRSLVGAVGGGRPTRHNCHDLRTGPPQACFGREATDGFRNAPSWRSQLDESPRVGPGSRWGFRGAGRPSAQGGPWKGRTSAGAFPGGDGWVWFRCQSNQERLLGIRCRFLRRASSGKRGALPVASGPVQPRRPAATSSFHYKELTAATCSGSAGRRHP
jgi:hypothetical protein